ncbi:unnamed protein product [Orchesella dallaii]|uniref:F-box domain-containing protein n=1 Tax=Orchesella dallaii TaxID=48710 RepID=A0ABP1RYJ5_9HEXA
MDLVTVTPQPPEEIFPLNIWDLILDHLKSPSDLLNCSKTCREWAKLLELKKTTFLMPQVFPILYSYLGPNKNNEGEEEDEEEEEKEEDSKLTTVLKMRLISHSWKESVDTFYQDHSVTNDIGFLEQDLENVDYSDTESGIPLRLYSFGTENVAKLESFVSRDFSPDCNPFITRYLDYKDSIARVPFVNGNGRFQDPECVRSRQRRRSSFQTMLKSFGSQIWTFILSFTSCSSSSIIELYKLMRRYLVLMPNLKALEIGCCCDEMKVSGCRTEFKALLRKEPMPRLENLKLLKLSGVPFAISKGILSQNPKLQKLYIDFDCRKMKIDPLQHIGSVELPGLEQLSVSRFSRVNLARLQNLVLPNLKGLNLTVKGKQLKDVFGAVSASSFSSSLEHFILEVCNGFMLDRSELQQPQQQLVLPNLRKFKFITSVDFELETIDFLEDCTALQEIDLDIQISKKNRRKKKKDKISNYLIQFKDCMNSMQNSNIWQLLPLLKHLKIKTDRKECSSKAKYTFTKGQSGKITTVL